MSVISTQSSPLILKHTCLLGPVSKPPFVSAFWVNEAGEVRVSFSIVKEKLG